MNKLNFIKNKISIIDIFCFLLGIILIIFSYKNIFIGNFNIKSNLYSYHIFGISYNNNYYFLIYFFGLFFIFYFLLKIIFVYLIINTKNKENNELDKLNAKLNFLEKKELEVNNKLEEFFLINKNLDIKHKKIEGMLKRLQTKKNKLSNFAIHNLK